METCRHPSRPPLFPGPFPPPPPFQQTLTCPHAANHSRSQRTNDTAQRPCWWRSWMKKYVILCLLCGGLSVILGIVFIVIYFFLRSYTSSLQFFETIPTYVPAVVLILTGLMVMCFAKRRNRYAYLIKLAGGCCLVCALLCVVITVTTTVVHMNRLQMLHECVYTVKAKTCTCVSAIADPNSQDGSHRFVFNNTPNCEVVHGSLFACLRTLFGFSVIGILVCIFSSMLVFQLLTHEKKKVYFEQLEVRRRFLYRRYPHHGFCNCCEEFYSWQLWDMLDYRLVNRHRPLSPSLETDEHSPSINSNQSESPQRTSNWCWLQWPWHRLSSRNQQEPATPFLSAGAPGGRQRGGNARNGCREVWNHLTLSPSSIPQESPESPVVSPWRNECVHIFRPNIRGAQAIHFGIRPRGVGHYGRHWHRRTRSNDGVFHHLHLNPSSRQPYTSTDGSSFLANYEIPRYMWGPPPPYSHPASVDSMPAVAENMTEENLRSIDGVSCRPLELTCLPGPLEMDVIPTHSEKSTPISQRRLLCHDFTSDSIRLTIGGNTPQGDMVIHDEHNLNHACVVEVHVPYIINKQEIAFNTLPARSCKKRDLNPFKSLSNIPLSLSRRLHDFKHDRHMNQTLSVIQSCFELHEMYKYPSDDSVDIHDVVSIFCPNSPNKTFSSEVKMIEENSANTSNTTSVTNTEHNSVRFPTTILELPSDFRSSIIIATSPSTPVTENVTLIDMCYAQSMPNLSVSNTPTVCSIHKTPSSGNTSTSQDFADFELEEDSSPIGMVPPDCDVLSVKSLPEDGRNETVILETPVQFQSVYSSPPLSSSYNTCSCQYLTSDSSGSSCNHCSSSVQVDSDSSISIVPRRFYPMSSFMQKSFEEGEVSRSGQNSTSLSPGNSNDKFVITIKSINV